MALSESHRRTPATTWTWERRFLLCAWVGHPSNYAVADAILKDPGVQAAVARRFALGIAIDEDYFVASAEQVMPFVPQQ